MHLSGLSLLRQGRAEPMTVALPKRADAATEQSEKPSGVTRLNVSDLGLVLVAFILVFGCFYSPYDLG